MKRSPRSYPQFSFRAGRVSDGGPFLAECLSGFPAFAENDGMGHLPCTLAHLHSSPSLQSGGPCFTFLAKNFLRGYFLIQKQQAVITESSPNETQGRSTDWTACRRSGWKNEHTNHWRRTTRHATHGKFQLLVPSDLLPLPLGSLLSNLHTTPTHSHACHTTQMHSAYNSLLLLVRIFPNHHNSHL